MERTDQELVRIEKSNNIRELGMDPFGQKFERTDYAQDIKDKYLIDANLEYINKLINDTDFSKLYNNEISLFSIGFNIEENKLTDSYYDFLASEARQASIVAIAKKDIQAKHWNNLSRTLTSLNGYKGLVSWTGTAFEYLMPNITLKRFYKAWEG